MFRSGAFVSLCVKNEHLSRVISGVTMPCLKFLISMCRPFVDKYIMEFEAEILGASAGRLSMCMLQVLVCPETVSESRKWAVLHCTCERVESVIVTGL